jgi:transposase
MAIWGNEVWIEAEIRRLRCRKCDDVVTEAVPWARHESKFTRPFEDAVALLAQKTDKTAVAELTGIAWETVGAIAARVVAEKLDPCGSRIFAASGLTRSASASGIDT